MRAPRFRGIGRSHGDHSGRLRRKGTGLNAVMLWIVSRRATQGAVYAAVLVLAASLAVVIVKSYSTSFSGRADAYCVGEWLINYGGGFVRRGLGGTAILGVSQAFGLRPRLVLFGVLVACYALTFFALAVVLLRARTVSILELLLVLSPFAALYPVLHHEAGQRKEVLMLAMASVAYLTDAGALRSAAKYVLWSAGFAALVAINDGALFFLPVLVFYLRVLTPPAQPLGWRATALVTPALAVFLAGYLHSSHVDIEAICRTTQRYEQGLWCMPGAAPGSFPVAASWLKATAVDGVRSVLDRYTLVSGTLVVLLGLLGLLPVLVALVPDLPQLRCALRGLPVPGFFVAAGIVGFAVLFAVANDWSRWFYILTSLLTLVHFAARDQRSGRGS
jgi:hypothetical protein